MAERTEQDAISQTSGEQTRYASEFVKAQAPSNKSDLPIIWFTYYEGGNPPALEGSFCHPISIHQEEQSFGLPGGAELVNLANQYIRKQGIKHILYNRVELVREGNSNPLIVTVVPSGMTCERDIQLSISQTISSTSFINVAGFSVYANGIVSGMTQYSIIRQADGKDLAEKISSTDQFGIKIYPQYTTQEPTSTIQEINFMTTWGSQEDTYKPSTWTIKDIKMKQVEAWKRATLQITGDYLVFEVRVYFTATLAGQMAFRRSDTQTYDFIDIKDILPNLQPLQLKQGFKASKVVNIKGAFDDGDSKTDIKPDEQPL